jgi:1-acyl-sn-glycerol-3-phosphate acyltransferase
MTTPTLASAAPPAARERAGRAAGALVWLRALAFNALFYLGTFLFVLAVLPLTLAPTRRPIAGAMRLWARATLALMRGVAGIRVAVEGREHLPARGPYLLAAKHQSEADGIALLALVPDLACVAMQEVARYPLVGPILRKLDMVLIDSNGGEAARRTLLDGAARAAAAGRPMVIYPEGTLMKVGERGPYRPGLYHVARTLGLPVVPVATSMGLGWDRRCFVKRPARVVVRFLPARAAGPDKAAFMAELADTLEAESNALARG